MFAFCSKSLISANSLVIKSYHPQSSTHIVHSFSHRLELRHPQRPCDTRCDFLLSILNRKITAKKLVLNFLVFCTVIFEQAGVYVYGPYIFKEKAEHGLILQICESV
jgi:hypothetical protein